MIDYYKQIITSVNKAKIGPVNLFIVTTLVYIIGFIIYNLPMGYYFPNLRHSGFRLIEYICATILWIVSFLIFKAILKYIIARFLRLNRYKIFLFAKYVLSTIIFLFIANYLSHSIYDRNGGITSFIYYSVLGRIIYLFSFNVWTNFLIKEIANIILNEYYIMYFISSIYLIKAIQKRSVKYKTILFLVIINLISFSHTIYTKIPRTFGGGKIVSANFIFEKGYVPSELATILKEGKDYYAFIVDEDENSYYVVFQEDDAESFYNWFYSKGILNTIFTPQNEFKELWRNANVIPKKNIARIIIR